MAPQLVLESGGVVDTTRVLVVALYVCTARSVKLNWLRCVSSSSSSAGEEAAAQNDYDKHFRAAVEDRRRARLIAAQEQNPPKQLSAEEMEDDVQRNQFNFTERAAQSFDNTTKTRVVSTTPPESTSARGSMTQWALYDAYVVEYDRMIYVGVRARAARAADARVHAHPRAPRRTR